MFCLWAHDFIKFCILTLFHQPWWVIPAHKKISCNPQGEGGKKLSETPISLQYMIPIRMTLLVLCTLSSFIFSAHIYGSQILLFLYATSLLYVLNVKSLSGQMSLCNLLFIRQIYFGIIFVLKAQTLHSHVSLKFPKKRKLACCHNEGLRYFMKDLKSHHIKFEFLLAI